MTDSCEARLPDHLTRRLEHVADIQRRIGSDDVNVSEEAQDEFYELPLSVELVRRVKVLLSTGGPGDWFECVVDDDGDIGLVEYHFQDWFDHASVVLDGDERDTAIDFLYPFVESFTSQGSWS